MPPEAYDTAAPILDRPAGPDTGKGQDGGPAARRAEGLRPPPPRRTAAPPPPPLGRDRARSNGASATRRRWLRLGAALGAVLMSPVLVLALLVLLSAPAERPRHDLVAVGPGGDVAEAEASRSAVGTWGGGATIPAPPGADPATATPADLSLELARLRAAVAAEGERLAALERRRDMLLASIEALQGKAAAGSPTAAVRSPEEGDQGEKPVPGPASAATAEQPLRIFVHHRAGSPAAERAAAEVAATLSAAGLAPAGTRAFAAVPSVRVVRYFHDADAAAAARVAARLGPGWAIQDFRAFSPSPPPQTVEIWLPDR